MNISSYIDHTLLKPEATPAQITALCEEAKQYHFASVCINPSYVARAANLLRGSGVKVCTVIGFPLGATSTAAKLYEASTAIHDGATELDMVINVGRLKFGDTVYVKDEIEQLARVAHDSGAILKVIIETALLGFAQDGKDERVLACELALSAGADFVKTSTGFTHRGASVNDVVVMRKAVGPNMGVKASGGISTYADAKAMIDAGATRIGTSKGVVIAKDVQNV